MHTSRVWAQQIKVCHAPEDSYGAFVQGFIETQLYNTHLYEDEHDTTRHDTMHSFMLTKTTLVQKITFHLVYWEKMYKCRFKYE